MAHRELSGREQPFYRFGQFQQTKKVCDGRSLFSDAARNLLLRQTEIVMELVVCVGLFHRVEIFALDVLDERNLQCVTVVMEILNYGWDALQASPLRRAKSALAGDQPKLMIAGAADDERLNDAVFA